MKKRITPRNIYWYLKGNTRYIFYTSKWLSWMIPLYIREQLDARLKSVDLVCSFLGECKECGCSVPQLQMADPNCDGMCYPSILSKEQWRKLKKGGTVEQDKLTWFLTKENTYANV